MSRYLLTVRSHTGLEAFKSHAAPADYLVETGDAPADDAEDGLEHWSLDLQLAGSIADWAKAPAYDAFWAYLREVLNGVELRPRLALRVRSRFDPHSVTVQVAYADDRDLQRAAESVRQKLQAALEPKTKKMKDDLSLSF